jgi:DNA-binding NtrC family response regulator
MTEMPEAMLIIHLDDELAMPLALRHEFDRKFGRGKVEYRALRRIDDFLALCKELASNKSISPRSIDCVLIDLDLGSEKDNGIHAMEQAKAVGVTAPIIILSGNDDTRLMSSAIQRGAADYISKAESLQVVCDRVNRTIEKFHMRPGPGDVRSSSGRVGGVVGETMAGVADTLGRVLARGISPVLVRGESGTGKEMVANVIESLLENTQQPFVRVNCASLHEETMESELFGHEKGAFTGAERAKVGLFESANGGWIFLDEVAKLSTRAQANLLRVLESGEIRPLGATAVRMLRFCVVAATNEDLESLAAQGLFRLDLLERLRGYVINLPPLRQRSVAERIAIQEHLLERLRRESENAVGFRLDSAAQKLILSAPFQRSNVRELWNLLQAAAVEADDGVISLRCLPPSFLEEQVSPAYKSNDGASDESLSFIQAGDVAEMQANIDLNLGYDYLELVYFSRVVERLANANPEHIRSVRSLAAKLKVGRHVLTRKMRNLESAGLLPVTLRHLIY